jgi:hypothetical protein
VALNELRQQILLEVRAIEHGDGEAPDRRRAEHPAVAMLLELPHARDQEGRNRRERREQPDRRGTVTLALERLLEMHAHRLELGRPGDDLEPGRVAAEPLDRPGARLGGRLAEAVDGLHQLGPRRRRVPAGITVDFRFERGVSPQLGTDLQPEEGAGQLAVELLGEALGLIVSVRP